MSGWNPSRDLDARFKDFTAYAYGADDPTAVAVEGRTGTVYVQIGTINRYQKQDDGKTTNWVLIPNAAFPSSNCPRVLFASSFNAAAGNGSEANPFQSLQAAVDAVNAAVQAEAGHRTNKRFIICICPDSRFDEDLEIPAALHLTLWCKGTWTLGDAALNDMQSSVARNLLLHVDQNVEDLDGVPLNRPAFNIVSANRGISSSTHPGYSMNATISGDFLINDGTEGNPTSNTELNLNGVRINGNLDGILNSGALPLNCFFNSVFIGGFYNVPFGFLVRVIDSELHDITCSDYGLFTRCEISNITTDDSTGLGVPPTGFFDTIFKNGFTFTRGAGAADFLVDETSRESFNNAGGVLAGGANLVRLDVDENETASNQGGFNEPFITKVGLDLQFRTFQSSDGSLTITQNASDLDFVANPANIAGLTGNPDRIAFYDNAGNLVEEADLQYFAANNNWVKGAGHTVNAGLSNALITGNNHTVAGINNIIGGDGNSSANTSSNSIVTGSSNIVTQTNNGLVCGNSLTLSHAGFNNCVIGNSYSVLGQTDNSYIGGNAHVTVGALSDSLMVGREHTFDGNKNQCLIGGFQNALDSSVNAVSLDSSLMVGTGHILDGAGAPFSASSSGIFGDNYDFRNTVNRSIIAGDGNKAGAITQGIIQNSLISGFSLTATTLDNSVVCGSQNTVGDASNCLIGGESNVVNGFSNLLIVGALNTATRNNQIIGGDNMTPNAQALLETGVAGTAMFGVDDDGLLRRDQGGLRVKTRVDAGDPVAINARTDYMVKCTNGAVGVVVNLPAGINGMEYIIKERSVGGALVVTPSGGDTIDGLATLPVANNQSAHLIFEGGEWAVV